MPRVAKDKVEKDIIENVKAVGEAPKSSNRTKKSASVKAVEKDNNPKKTKNKSTSDVAKKGSSSKETKTTKKATDKKNSARRSSTSSKTTRKKKDTTKPDIIEYYDLPFRYNQTTVKVLAQTPTNLFIYWDISDADRNKLIDTYGNYFFENTKPVLIITNETMNYTFEIDINDFANSWYLHVKNSNCKYKVELGRRPITHEIVIPNNYVYISSSNAMDAPNDHILFDELQQNVFFKNVKTNVVTEKNILTISHLINMGKIYNIYELYKKMYKDETTPIRVTGKILSNKEIEEIKEIIKSKIDVKIKFDSPTTLGLHSITRSYKKDVGTSETTFHKGSLRSGQKIEVEGSLVVIGDVNSGAEVIAADNIAIIGTLRGLAHAGAKGNKEAIITASTLDAVQIRISNIVKEIDIDSEYVYDNAYIYVNDDEIVIE